MPTEYLAMFDPATVVLMRAALDEAWASLSKQERASTSQVLLADRILRAAGNGERDPDRLGAVAQLCLAPMPPATA